MTTATTPSRTEQQPPLRDQTGVVIGGSGR